jgi:hypothetical protein
LTGTENRVNDDEKNSFCALVKDELYSDKASEDAGGSFGLGKSLLWAYSSMKTVIFASAPVEHPTGAHGPRFIGRTSLPYHETDHDGPCSGDGWLGVRRGHDEHDRRAESLWGEHAASRLEPAVCAREADDTGLSAVIVGFSEPGEEDRDLADVMQSVVDAALESFWPAITRGDLIIDVTHEVNDELRNHRTVDPLVSDAYRPVAQLLRAYDKGEVEEVDSLEDQDYGLRWIPIRVPQRNEDPDPHEEYEGHVGLLIQLLDDDQRYAPIKDHAFRFRRPGMIVRSSQRSNLSINARPYVALVVCGRACRSGLEHDRVERFLRCAEPPAHDQWTHNTRAIKEQYKAHGCRKKLEEFEMRIRNAIRGLVSPPEEPGGPLPKKLLQHLRFGDSGGGGHPRFLSVTRPRARVEGDIWTFDAHCRRVIPDDGPWVVTIHLKYAVDGGGADDVRAIAEVGSSAASKAEVHNGVGYLEFPPDVERANISGRTDAALHPAVGTRSAIRLRIDGRAGGMDNA